MFSCSLKLLNASFWRSDGFLLRLIACLEFGQADDHHNCLAELYFQLGFVERT